MKRVYLDYASTTPIDKRVLAEFILLSKNYFGNPGSVSKEGVSAKAKLAEARKVVANFLSCRPFEIVFTSGGTESNNLAIFGVVSSLLKKGRKYSDMHIVSSGIEHSSILECLKFLEEKGVLVSYLKVDSRGLVDVKELRKIINEKTVLVSVMFANNEIGVIEPIKEIAKEVRFVRKSRNSSYPLFHTDASQVANYEELKVDSLGVDLLTLDGQKMYGPRGVGALYVKSGVSIEPMIFGGGQEDGVRSGTENLSLIGAFAKAVSICEEGRAKEAKRTLLLRDFLIKEIGKIFEDVVFNGDLEKRLPNNVNFSLKNIDTEMLTLRLDSKGFAVSTKSACLGSGVGSYVVQALGAEDWRQKNTIRISIGRYTTKDDCINFIKTLSSLKKKFF